MRPPEFGKAALLGAFSIAIALWQHSVITQQIAPLRDEYRCLAQALRARDLNTVGVDYWASKPLWAEAPGAFSLIVIDYQRWESFPWISPRAWGTGATETFVYRRQCVQDLAHCAVNELALRTVRVESVCNAFDIVTVHPPQTFEWPEQKAQSVVRSFRRNLDKAKAAWRW